MARSLVLHRVADYDAWRRVYDSVAPMQAAGGVTAESVHRWRVIPTTSWLSTTSTRFQPPSASSPAPSCGTRCSEPGVKTEPRVDFYD